MEIVAVPAPWLLAAAYLHVLPAVALTADAVARPPRLRRIAALLCGRIPAHFRGRVRAFAGVYALSAVFLAAATVSSVVRQDWWVWSVMYAALTVLTARSAHAWNTALGKPPATRKPAAPSTTTAGPDRRSEDTPPNTGEHLNRPTMPATSAHSCPCGDPTEEGTTYCHRCADLADAHERGDHHGGSRARCPLCPR